MASIVLGCDTNGNDAEYQETVKKVLESKGHSVEKLTIGPNYFATYSYDSSKAKGKIGIYLIAAGTYSIADATFGNTFFDYNYFGIRPEVSPNWDSSDFDTKPIGADADCPSSLCAKIAGKSFKEINEIVKDRSMVVTGKDANDMGNALATAISTGGFSSSSDNQNDGDEEDDEEEWDDKDNFTPHKGKIMEIRPYKEIASISFDKSYDSPTGTGSVELLYSAKDYRYLYKGVAMKLKLRRSCDKEWSNTGLEEPDYDENEKFFKEHIPTDELLKELGLPNYRKRSPLTNTDSSTVSDDSGDSMTGDISSDTGNSSSVTPSSSSTSSRTSNRGSSNRVNNSSNSSSKNLSRAYINSLSPTKAKELAKQTNKYDSATIKALRRRAMGLYW